MTGRVTVILLAAGSSTRFGSAKQLATLDGLALVERALTTIRQTKADNIILVLGNRADEIRKNLKEDGLVVVVNERFMEGLSTSLKAGLTAVKADSDAVVVVLADQPLVTSELIDELISRNRERGTQVAASVSGQLVSPPVLLGRSVFGEIEALRGDVGAKSIVMKHKEAELVEVAPDVLLDIDTPEDMERARRLLTQR